MAQDNGSKNNANIPIYVGTNSEIINMNKARCQLIIYKKEVNYLLLFKYKYEYIQDNYPFAFRKY